MIRNFVIFTSMCLMLAWASVASAVAMGVSGDHTTPAFIEYYSGGGTSSIDVGSSGSPIEIYYDPSAGPWQKIFQNYVAAPDKHLNVNEVVDINQGVSWTDWDEQIVSLGWVWGPNSTLTLSNDPTVVNGQVSVDQKTVVFDLPAPEGPGTVLTITKTLWWVGGGGAPATVTINEWPTVPEPGTIVLLMTGLLALGMCYIRRRN